jgi:hypothetical protein
MILFTAIMRDETRTEFTVARRANSRAEARETLKDDYPESVMISISTPQELEQYQLDRDARINRQIDEGDWF